MTRRPNDKRQESSSNNNQSSSSAKNQNSSSSGEKIAELLRRLHVAIQQHQHYPASALQMHKQGKVTLSFMLLTNGYINNLTLLKSSGVQSLDEAALTAVRDAVPFLGLESYLAKAKTFSIDVVFDLDSGEA